jgi:hypothetical protein
MEIVRAPAGEQRRAPPAQCPGKNIGGHNKRVFEDIHGLTPEPCKRRGAFGYELAAAKQFGQHVFAVQNPIGLGKAAVFHGKQAVTKARNQPVGAYYAAYLRRRTESVGIK